MYGIDVRIKYSFVVGVAVVADQHDSFIRRAQNANGQCIVEICVRCGPALCGWMVYRVLGRRQFRYDGNNTAFLVS